MRKGELNVLWYDQQHGSHHDEYANITQDEALKIIQAKMCDIHVTSMSSDWHPFYDQVEGG